jgi:CRISPR-associated protein Csm3
VRDVFLDASSLAGARTDFLSTEVKWEASIDRITSAALPRQMERVPAGGLFRPFEMVCGLYAERSDHSDMDAEVERLRTLFEAMQLLEDDYLGGMGTRGSGKVRFEGIGLTVRKGAESEPIEVQSTDAKGPLIADIIAQQQSIIERVKQLLSAG